MQNAKGRGVATEKLEVQITLDDGSVIKGFTNIEKGAVKAGQTAGRGFETGLKSATANIVSDLGRQLVALGTAFLSFQALGNVVRNVRELDTAFAEIKTIIPDVAQANEELKQSFIDLSGTFGTTAAEQAKSFYSIVSAGITDTATAQQLLTDANKLAIGGLTDTQTAIDILTSSINAFGKENLSSSNASDILFGTVRLGKTRIEELASSLGQILPTASALKVSFADTSAAIAALTTRGISTSEAVTQLNAVLTAVLKKQDTAKTFGKTVADAFSLQALQTKGLTNFLKDLNIALGGNERALVKLLGRAEGARAILTLAGDGFKTLGSNVDQLNNSAGAADQAFEKINNTIGAQLDQLGSKISAFFSGIAGASNEGFVNTLKGLNNFVATLIQNTEFILAFLGKFTQLTFSFIAAQRLLPIALQASKFSLLAFGNTFRGLIGQVLLTRQRLRRFREEIGLIPTRIALAKLSITQLGASLRNLSFKGAVTGLRNLRIGLKATKIGLKALRIGINLTKAALTFGLSLAIDFLIEKFFELKESFGGFQNLLNFGILKIKKRFQELVISSINLVKNLERIPVLGEKFKSNFGGALETAAENARMEIKKLNGELDTLNEKITRDVADPAQFQDRPDPTITGDTQTEIGGLTEAELEEQRRRNEEINKLLDGQSEKTKTRLAEQASVAQLAWSNIASSIGSQVGVIEFKLADLEAAGRRSFANIARAGIEGFGRAFSKIGEALVKGENAFAAFGKSILGVLGDVAIQAGTVYLLLGIASFNPVQIAAGLGLIVLGGVLKALAGGGGSGSAAGVGGGGGLGSNPIDGNESPVSPELQNQGAAINLTIQGDVLDSEGTALRISDIIKSEFGQNGVQIT